MLLSSLNFLEPKDSFKVYARIRPFAQKQQKLQSSRQFFSHDLTSISVKTKNFQQNFTFDHIFNSESQQSEIFDLASREIIDNAFKGINGSIFCYGQTSSGKTHTIVGDYGSNVLENEGLMPRILKEVIARKDQMIDDAKSSKLDVRIKVSMIEIYNQKIFDLLDLSRKDLRLRQNKKQGVFVENLTEKYISSVAQAMKFFFSGLENRSSGKTNQNTVSSRSHMIFAISIVETDFERKEAKSSTITLIDLAGSQRLGKTGVQGKMLLETKKINLSLSTLGKVINALSDGSKKHIPYRDSKLTRLLKQSIGGNCLTRLIINLSPSSLNESETVSALRFGSTAKLIKNRPRINKEYTVEELLILLERAELKIKELNKFIQEFDKNRLNQSGLSNQLFELRAKAAQAIPFHLVDYNDEQSDEKISVQGSKVSSVNQSSQYLSNDGSGVFSSFGIDIDIESPEVKKQYKKPVITSCKSMKLLPFNNSPDFKVSNQNKLNKQETQQTLRVSAFIENQEEVNFNPNSCRSSRMIDTSNVEDLSDILGNGLNLKRNCSLKMDDKLDFSVKSIHQSVNQIKQKCLKRMGMNKEKTKQVLIKQTQTKKDIRQRGLEPETNNALPKILSIISCFSIKLETSMLSEQTSRERPGSQELGKCDQASCELFYQTKSTLQRLQEPSSMLKEQKSVSVECHQAFERQGNKAKQAHFGQKSQRHYSINQIYQDNLQQLQTYKKIIKKQNGQINEMKRRETVRTNNLSQDIEQLKSLIAQKSPRSILSLQNIQKYNLSFDHI